MFQINNVLTSMYLITIINQFFIKIQDKRYDFLQN